MPSAQQAVFQVVMDTNVLVAAVRSRQGASFQLLRQIGEPRWQLNLSTALLFEYEEVTRREVAGLWVKPEKIEAVLDFICAHANRPRISYAWRPCLPDADDDMILELAVAARANFIVTHNRNDFKGAEQFGVGILSPGAFLRKLKETT